MVDRNDNLSELVDVYDITGKLVRKQAKRADAVKGLKKGIYIAGGKKYVVKGNKAKTKRDRAQTCAVPFLPIRVKRKT